MSEGLLGGDRLVYHTVTTGLGLFGSFVSAALFMEFGFSLIASMSIGINFCLLGLSYTFHEGWHLEAETV